MQPPLVSFSKNEALKNSLSHYLCYLGKQISCRFYQNRRFLVLPHALTSYGRSVFFPDLPYPKKYWQEVGKYTENDYPFSFDSIHKLAGDLINNSDLETTNEEIEKIEESWRKIEKNFFTVFSDFFPHYDLSKIGNITCTVSKFGTIGSFEFKKHKNGMIDLNFTHRIDQPNSGIAEKILSSFVNMDNPNFTQSEWEIRENTIDYLFLKTKLGQIFDFDYKPTVKNLPKLSENLVEKSENYLKKIGFPIKPSFSIDSGHLSIGSKPILNTFTETEKRILFLLISRRNQLISYDEIGNSFWGEEESLEKFSLMSIAKIMEKIRRKIKEHGIYQEMIYTIRSQGFVLYD